MGGMGRLRFALGLLPMACWHGDLGMLSSRICILETQFFQNIELF